MLKKIILISFLGILIVLNSSMLAVQKTRSQNGNGQFGFVDDMQKIVLLAEGDDWVYDYDNSSAWYNVSKRIAAANEYQIELTSNASEYLPDIFNEENDAFNLMLANISQENITTTARGNFLRRAVFSADILVSVFKTFNATTNETIIFDPPLVFSFNNATVSCHAVGDYALTVVTGNPTIINTYLSSDNFSFWYTQLAAPSDPYITRYENKHISVINLTVTTEQVIFESRVNASYSFESRFTPIITTRYIFAKDIGLAISKSKLLPPSQLMSLTSNWEVAHRLITFSIQNSNFGNQQPSRDKTTNGLQLFSVLLAVLIVSTIRRKN